MKKLVSFALALCLCLALAGCGDSGSLPEGMDKGAAEARAKEIVTAMNDRDFDRLVELYDGVEKYGHVPPTAAEWAASADSIEAQLQLGAFEKFTDIRFASAEDEALGGVYGVVIVGAKYEKKSISWRVSFDMEMECVGLRV